MAVRFFDRVIHVPSDVPCQVKVDFVCLGMQFDMNIMLDVSGLQECGKTKINLFFSDLEKQSKGLKDRFQKAIDLEIFRARICHEIYMFLIKDVQEWDEGIHADRLIKIISDLLPDNEESSK